MARNNSEEINFQHYVDLVKQKGMHWNLFVDVMEDISYSDADRLRRLNAILLNELTMDYSHIDKSKYLNVILLREFKNVIQKKHEIEVSQNEDFDNSEESNVHEILNEHKNEQVIMNSGGSNAHEILNEDIIIKKEDFVNSEESNTHEILNEDTDIKNEEDLVNYERSNSHDFLTKDNDNKNKEYFESSEEANIHENSIEDTNDMNKENLVSLYKEKSIECNPREPNARKFLCHICNNEYYMYFHLKQHIRKVHEKKKNITNIQMVKIIDRDATIKENASFSNENHLKIHVDANHKDPKHHKCKFCGKLLSEEGILNMHIHLNHEGHKCEICGKSFSQARTLKNHIHTVHEGHKDHKCKSCGKSFTEAGTLKNHIKTIHEDHKDKKCESCDRS